MTAPAALAALDAVAAHDLAAAAGLAGTSTADLDLDLVEDHGLAGLLLAAVDAGEIVLATDAVARLRERRADEAQLAVRLEAELLRLAPVLDRHGGVVLKGPALAHHVEADPSRRPFSDLDVLVAPASVELVLRDLDRLGYERPRPDPAPGYASRVAKATTVVHPTGLLIDLHRTVTLGAAGELVDVDELLAGRIELPAGTVAVPAPAWPAHLVVVALHAALGDGFARPRSLRDVVLVAHHRDQDPAAALALARRWGVADVLGDALRVASERLGAALPAELDAIAAEAIARPAVDGPRHRAEQLRRAGSVRARCTLARSLVAPSPSFLRWAYGDAPLPRLYARRWRDLRERTAPDLAGEPR